jgi:hypothetical protein
MLVPGPSWTANKDGRVCKEAFGKGGSGNGTDDLGDENGERAISKFVNQQGESEIC